MSRLPQAIRPWALMLLMLAAATALRGVLDPVLGDRAPFITYYPLTVFLALYAGARPAAVSVALSVMPYTRRDGQRVGVRWTVHARHRPHVRWTS